MYLPLARIITTAAACKELLMTFLYKLCSQSLKQSLKSLAINVTYESSVPSPLIISFRYFADPSPSWEWEWSSWAWFFSSSFSWCKTRQKLTLCFTVHHQKRASVGHQWRMLVCFIVSLYCFQYLQSSPSPAWWV